MGSLLRGLALGFAIAVPVGPIGVLCIRRSVAHGRLAGFLSGLGAASADALYGSVAAFGLTGVTRTLVEQQTAFRLVGGIALIALGARTFMANAATKSRSSPAAGYLSTLALTLTNPTTILSFAAAFAGLGLAEERSNGAAALLVLGVFAGSAIWWAILSTSAAAFARRLHDHRLRTLNRVSGIAIAVFGVAALASLL